jgi:hypothetical protein
MDRPPSTLSVQCSDPQGSRRLQQDCALWRRPFGRGETGVSAPQGFVTFYPGASNAGRAALRRWAGRLCALRSRSVLCLLRITSEVPESSHSIITTIRQDEASLLGNWSLRVQRAIHEHTARRFTGISMSRLSDKRTGAPDAGLQSIPMSVLVVYVLGVFTVLDLGTPYKHSKVVVHLLCHLRPSERPSNFRT